MFALVASLAVASCRSDRGAPVAGTDASVMGMSSPADSSALGESDAVRERIEELRARFSWPAAPETDSLSRAAGATDTKRRAVIGGGTVRFEVSDAHAKAIVPVLERRAARTATVMLPLRASDPVTLEDDATRVAVSFALRGASDASIAIAGGIALYTAALEGADVVHRVHAQGSEDFIVFEDRPSRETIAYDVDVSRVAALRFVSNTLELLDASGAPRLRVAPPYVIDARGAVIEAKLAIEGCAYDGNPAPPWGRAVPSPGAARCSVRVAWHADAYPAIVDPNWTTTGSLATARYVHSATLLNSGKVLVAGGFGGSAYLSSAELYDATSGTFAATGALATARWTPATLLASGKVLFAGGGTLNGFSSASAELYDPTAGTFTPTGSLAQTRSYHTATLLASGKVLIAGGLDVFPIASAELYDPALGTFAATGSLVTGRHSHTETRRTDGTVLLIGGSSQIGEEPSTERYDPSTGAFTVAPAMLSARAEHVATRLATGEVFVNGGRNGSTFWSTAEVTSFGVFAAAGSMAVPRIRHTATLVAAGKVLVVGGSSSFAGNPLSSAEIFDPSGAGTFALIGSLMTARRSHTATLLNSGKVLIVGGANSANAALSSAELFAFVAPGSACGSPSECVSGVCDENCCTAACNGVCKTCAAGTGACTAVVNADDPDTCTGVSTCDGSGACKKKVGQACPGGNGDCANGQCVDGYCCNTACAGQCDSCNLGGSLGTCAPALPGSPGSPACGAAVCDGANAACPTTCTSDTGCATADYCAANGTCQTRKAQASTCNQAAGADCKVAGCRDCASGSCVDGFCCNTACNSGCVACAASLQQTQDGGLPQDGVCGPVKDDTNPHNDACPIDGPMSCGHDGMCNGAGGCRLYYPPGTSCGSSICDTMTNKARGLLCSGSGTCANDPGGVDCRNFLCANGSCPNSCTLDTQCIATAYCKLGTCIPKVANGVACTSGNQCSSTICADGVCCNAPCQGQCEACNVMGGLGACVPVSGAPVAPRAACSSAASGNVCSAALCDGTTRATCAGFVGSLLKCRSASCVSGVQTLPASCDGKGNCPDAVTKKCDPYTCDSAASACKTVCGGDGDCVNGTKCSSGVCVSGATCDADGHTSRSADGKPEECAPYRCDSTGACRRSCTSVDACVSPNVCDRNGACVSPSASTGDSGGCSIAVRGTRSSSTDLGWLALAAVLAGARRRARSRLRGETNR